MRTSKRSNPPGRTAGYGTYKTHRGQRQQHHNPNAPPLSFWKGFNGTQSMAPQIHRRQPKPEDTFWKPKRAGGRS